MLRCVEIKWQALHSCERLVTGNVPKEYYRGHFNIQVYMTEDLHPGRRDCTSTSNILEGNYNVFVIRYSVQVQTP